MCPLSDRGRPEFARPTAPFGHDKVTNRFRRYVSTGRDPNAVVYLGFRWNG